MAWTCYPEWPGQHYKKCLEVDTRHWKEQMRPATRNLEENDRGWEWKQRDDVEWSKEDCHRQRGVEISGLRLMCHTGARRIVLCHVTSYHVMSCHVMSCHVKKLTSCTGADQLRITVPPVNPLKKTKQLELTRFIDTTFKFITTFALHSFI